MKNCLILGSGRSGTSMVAGSLAGSGYFLGERLHPANEANPKGYFEDDAVNTLNEHMLARVLPRRPQRLLLRRVYAHRPDYMQRWVAALPVETSLPALSDDLARQRDALASRTPLLFKDPRFCYTLPYWRPAIEARFICVFREPGRTARSILTDCKRAPYMRSLRLDVAQALRVWTCMYQHALRHHDEGDDWLFVHYDQFLQGPGADAVEDFLGVPVDRSFADPSLKRSADDIEVPAEARDLYTTLCRLANWSPE
jgi:hypothetical protein